MNQNWLCLTILFADVYLPVKTEDLSIYDDYELVAKPEDDIYDDYELVAKTSTGKSRSNEKCESIKFIKFAIDKHGLIGYRSPSNIALDWFAAVCCCRRRGMHLFSPINEEEMQELHNFVPFAGKNAIGWVDINGFVGSWKNLLREGPKPKNKKDFYAFPNKKPNPATCMELGSKHSILGNKSDTTYFAFGHDVLPCHQATKQILLCVEYNRTLQDDCFRNAKGCNKVNIIQYAKSDSCPEDGKNSTKLETPETGTNSPTTRPGNTPNPDRTSNSSIKPNDPIHPPEEKCTRNCLQLGWCTEFEECVPINGTWEWDDESEVFRGQWQRSVCPDPLVWNPYNATGRNGSCDFFENLPAEKKKEYKTNTSCWQSCKFEEHEDLKIRCTGKFWYHGRTNASSWSLDDRVLKQCPTGLVFNIDLKTCTKCQDASLPTKIECCSHKSERNLHGLHKHG